MKIKTLLSTLIVALAVIFASCDDNLNVIGNNIQPDSDGISLAADTINVTATTYSFNNRIYARTTKGVVGEYTDPILGKVKSDYLCEFRSGYPVEGKAFDDRIFSVDSVQVNVLFVNHSGESEAVMGITAYEVDKKFLDGNDLYTDIDPEEYCTKEKVYAKGMFSIKKSSNGEANIASMDADTTKGWDIYNAWKNNDLKDSETFKKNVLKGLYITNTFGSGTLIEVAYTTLDVYYRINAGKKVHENTDSIVSRMFRLNVTQEVVQMNRVQNTIDIEALQGQRDTRTFMKSPAGVCTQINIPIKDIVNRMGNKKNINSASLKLLGFTEAETELGEIRKPSYVLFMHKDSVDSYFRDGGYASSKGGIIVSRASNNTYNINSGNIASTLSYYIDYYKKNNMAIEDTLRYLLVPIDAETAYNSSSGTYVPTGKSTHLMYPSSAILRTDPKNLKMPLIFSKYNNQE